MSDASSMSDRQLLLDVIARLQAAEQAVTELKRVQKQLREELAALRNSTQVLP